MAAVLDEANIQAKRKEWEVCTILYSRVQSIEKLVLSAGGLQRFFFIKPEGMEFFFNIKRGGGSFSYPNPHLTLLAEGTNEQTLTLVCMSCWGISISSSVKVIGQRSRSWNHA